MELNKNYYLLCSEGEF